MQSTRRITVLDIETVSIDPNDPKGALDAMTGRIACIGLLFDDGVRAMPEPICEENEKRMLERFWAALGDTDLFVGHNLLGFDLNFIRQRSIILGVKPPFKVDMKKYYTTAVYDTMEVWTNWAFKKTGATLDNLAWMLGCDGLDPQAWQGKEHHIAVAQWWAEKNFGPIVKGCMHDVWRAYQVYCRMEFRQPLRMLAEPSREIPAGRELPWQRAQEPEPAYARVPAPPAQKPLTYEERERGPEPRPPAAAGRRGGAGGGRRSRQKAICYSESGTGSLVLSGDTFPIKDDLKTIGGRFSKESGEWVCQVPCRQYGPLADLCGRAGILLAPAPTGKAA